MAAPENSDGPSEGVKQFLLRLHKPAPVETSLGTLYARHLTVGDKETLSEQVDTRRDKEGADLKAFGRTLLMRLVCVDMDSDEKPGLSDEVYSRLTPQDLFALSEGVGKLCDVTLPADLDPVEALGSAVFDLLVEQGRRFAESAAQIQKTLDRSFGGMSAAVKAALSDNLFGLSAIREGLKASSAVEAVRKAQEERERVFGNFQRDLTGTTAVSAALRKVQGSQAELNAGLPKDLLFPGSQKLGRAEPTIFENLVQPPNFPKIEETPMGRAAIAGEKSALQLQEVSGLVGQMTEQLGRLHTLFLVDVIPQWVKNLEDGAKSTSTSIGLAKKAIYWSIGVTVLMTCWQLWVAREYKLENDRQQEISEALVRRQLEASQELNRQLTVDSRRLQEELSKLGQTVAAMQAATPPDVAQAKPAMRR